MPGETPLRKILVLGASGLIGRFVTDDLRERGFHVTGIARRYAPSQKANALDLEMPVMAMDSASLARLIRDNGIDVVVNCLGVLQDGPGSDVSAVHRDFVERLLQAIRGSGRAIRLVHISIPGAAAEDRTAFSRTKREAERLITVFGIPNAILRPGFVVAPSAYGGSDLLRALAAFPIDLPAAEAATPFQPVAAEDIAATIAWLGGCDVVDKTADAVVRDLMQPQPVTLVVWSNNFACASARRTSDASRCRPSCSISAPSSAISPTASAGCRQCGPPRSPNCGAASLAIRSHGCWRPASRRKRFCKRWDSVPPLSRTNGSPGCF
jgi:uncharacterized protein YbjT (DUF2867 family)